MKEINQSYFSSIRKRVNTHSYTHSKACHHIKPIPMFAHSEPSIQSMLKKHGFVLLQMDTDAACDIHTLETYLNKIAGDFCIDKNPHQLNFAKITAEINAKYYINSNLAQPIHTDEGHTIQLPRYVALTCLKQATVGGDSIVVPFHTLFAALVSRFGTTVNLLFKKDALTVFNVHGEEKKPILFKLNHHDVGISYSPVLQAMRCSEQIFQLFDFITSYVHNPVNQIRFKLTTHQIFLFDNTKILHGRTSFPTDDHRLLHRYWFGQHTL